MWGDVKRTTCSMRTETTWSHTSPDHGGEALLLSGRQGHFDPVDRDGGSQAEMGFIPEMCKAGGPLHNFTSASCILLCLLNHRESKGRESFLHFVRNGARARHFQPFSDEEDGVLLSDCCAMSCRYRLWWVPLARFTCKALWISLVPP